MTTRLWIMACSCALVLAVGAPAAAQATPGEMCSNTCRWANDGECDDGGVGAQYRVCGFGTDCNDCGSRNESQRRGLRPQGGLAHNDSFRLGLGISLASATHDTPIRLRGRKARIALQAPGMAIQLGGRWVGLFRRTAFGQVTGMDVRFGVQRFQADLPTGDALIYDGEIKNDQVRYDLWFDPLFRIDRPFGSSFGLTVSMGPTFSLQGAGIYAELQPRIIAGPVGIEPRVGIGTSTAVQRDLRFGGDLSFEASEKVSVAAGYLYRSGLLYQDGDHTFVHHTITLGVGL